MKLRSCENCGTEYDRALSQCPQCGSEPGSSKAAAAQEDRIPKWMWILICSVLGAAVLIGFGYFLFRMDYLDRRNDPPAPPPMVEEPVVVPVVDPRACTGLTLSRTVVVMEEAGQRVFLTVRPEPIDCPEDVTFASSDETVATVGVSGVITAVAEGEAEIYVTCGEVEEICTVICEFPESEEPEEEQQPEEEDPAEETEEEPEEEQPAETTEEEAPPAAPTLSSEDFTLFRPGEEARLTVKDAPENAVITYVSSDPSVATVSETGLVTAAGSGTATITVMVNDLKLTCIARCNLAATTESGDDAQPVGNYTISAVDVTLFQNGEAFTLSLRNEANQKANGVSWASENTSVCTVDANGKVTATGKGTTNVKTTYGGKTYSCIVRCSF